MITLVVTLIPISNVFAEGMADQEIPAEPTRQRWITLPRIWKFQQNLYERLGKWLDKTDHLVTRLQERIDKAKENEKNTASIQAALDVFIQANSDAFLIYQKGEAIITTHAGFDTNGKVDDRVLAVESIESLADVIRETRDVRRDPFRLLRDALRSFREANKPALEPTTPSP